MSAPDDFSQASACDPHNPDVAYIGTTAGLYRTKGTSDAGVTFTEITGIGATRAVANVVVL